MSIQRTATYNGSNIKYSPSRLELYAESLAHRKGVDLSLYEISEIDRWLGPAAVRKYESQAEGSQKPLVNDPRIQGLFYGRSHFIPFKTVSTQQIIDPKQIFLDALTEDSFKELLEIRS